MIAIIPARGGSKGLIGKNIKLLAGKPMIAYTVEAALNSKHISEVIVSTDDPNIAKIAKQFGAQVPYLRPDNLATDSSRSIDVLNYVIDRFDQENVTNVRNLVVLQPTSPLRKSHHIDEAIELFINKNADSVISYCKESHSIFWHKEIKDDGKFVNIFEGDFLKNRQDIKTTYYPNGAIYVFKRDLLIKNKYYSERSYGYVMDRSSSIDIDDIDDFNYAHFLMTKA
ncbi:cytidylyltransferase domain-containing protein [Nonlabens sp. Asnod2-A12]|uniref:acylneuraminate cytidylyltransferase family protein n=1 Tax=Nonlabens sp. Asnod2-A12 TaxID=3160578 RepID=UPI003863C488